MAIFKSTVRMRRGPESEFDESKMVSGELAIATDKPVMWFCWENGKVEKIEGSVTPEKLREYFNEWCVDNPIFIDETLKVSGKAADAKVTGDNITKLSKELQGIRDGADGKTYPNAGDAVRGQISELKGDIDQLSEEIANKTGTGLSTEAIDKLEEVGNYLAYTTADGGSKWTELISILRNDSSGGGSGETVPATAITLDKTALSFTDSATQTLVATVEPSNTTDKVVWTSNAESVATVTNGVVKPLSNGLAIITATCGSVSATCSVTVDIAEEEQVTLTSISATYTGGDVAVGTSLNDLAGITVTATYSDGSMETVTGYTLSGEITEGENTITVTYNGKTATFTVTGIAGSTGEEPEVEWEDGVPYVISNYTEGWYVNPSNGELVNYGDWGVTDYLSCKGASTITLDTPEVYWDSYNAFYDENKQFVSQLALNKTSLSVNVPKNAWYIRLSSKKANFATAVITPHA